MKTRSELLDFLEIEKITDLQEKICEHDEWDSIVALDLANYLEKELKIEFDLSSFDKFSWNELFDILKI